VVHVAGAGVGVVRVLEVEVIIAGLDVVDGDTPGAFILLAALEALGFRAPPGAFSFEFLDADGLALVVTLGAGRVAVSTLRYVDTTREVSERHAETRRRGEVRTLFAYRPLRVLRVSA